MTPIGRQTASERIHLRRIEEGDASNSGRLEIGEQCRFVRRNRKVILPRLGPRDVEGDATKWNALVASTQLRTAFAANTQSSSRNADEGRRR